MKIERKRQLSAWLLLSVFVPMMVYSALHVHPASCVDVQTECNACLHHLPHGGHLTTAAGHIHDCVLCQIMSIGFLPPAVLVVAVAVRLTHIPYENYVSLMPIRGGDVHGSRAPPAW